MEEQLMNKKNFPLSVGIAYAAMWISVAAVVIVAMIITQNDIDIFFLFIPAFCKVKFKVITDKDNSGLFENDLK